MLSDDHLASHVFEVESKAAGVASVVGPLPLYSEHLDGKTSTTRRVIDALVLDNPKNPAASVEITLRHQRRGPSSARWEDIPGFRLSRLQAEGETRIRLSAAETLALRDLLDDLYPLADDGIPYGRARRMVVDAEALVIEGRGKETLRALMNEAGGEFGDWLEALRPGFLAGISLAHEHAKRQAALAEFQAHLTWVGKGSGLWNEPDWKRFFESNRWIFGHGLDYRFLATLANQPHYGGVNMFGRGAQRGDHLMRTEAEARFTILVEIKRPDAELVSRPHRNGAYQLGSELTGGVTQVQTNCRTWAMEGSRTSTNARELSSSRVHTVEPKGILVVGHLGSLSDDPDRLATFEQFRRNLHNPEVLTYDELFSRADYLVQSAAPRRRVASVMTGPEEPMDTRRPPARSSLRPRI
jgi:hypothetical protein